MKIIGLFKNIIVHALSVLTLTKSKSLRNLYWDLRASDIYDKWGNNTDDFEPLAHVINKISAKKILDIGCGTARFFPLYRSLKVSHVVAQDISKKALDHAKKRFPDYEYVLFHGSIAELSYGEHDFDLVVSNRVLSAILPENIFAVIAKLCSLSTYIYLNELTDLDYKRPSTYWFKHDYDTLMRENGFTLVEKGKMSSGQAEAEWKLFKQT